MTGFFKNSFLISISPLLKKILNTPLFYLLNIVIWNSFYIYKKRFPEYKGQFFNFHQDLVKELIYLPENIVHLKQLITSKKSTPKNICHRNSTQIEVPVFNHVQE